MLIGHKSLDIKKAVESIVDDHNKLEHYKKISIERKEFFDVKSNIKKWEEILDD